MALKSVLPSHIWMGSSLQLCRLHCAMYQPSDLQCTFVENVSRFSCQ